MRYAPYPSEYLAVPTMTDGELLDYFLMRSVETEEVWGLQDSSGWLLREYKGQLNFPVWPYKRFASEAATTLWPNCIPTAVSLEHFVFENLPQWIDDDIGIDIMPRAAQPGCLITPHRLLDIIEGILDAGEYRLDG